ncbi:MAG: hypothetical protein ACT4OF_07275 [Caulobacteraceae bacterium]
MGRSDLDAVAARRAEIARALEGLEVKRTVLAAEDEELDVTERVLKRIDRLTHAETTFPANYVVDEPIHRRAIGVIRALVGGRLP